MDVHRMALQTDGTDPFALARSTRSSSAATFDLGQGLLASRETMGAARGGRTASGPLRCTADAGPCSGPEYARKNASANARSFVGELDAPGVCCTLGLAKILSNHYNFIINGKNRTIKTLLELITGAIRF